MRSVFHVSQDSCIGNGQKNETFWERIASHFNNHSSSVYRLSRSLESKWGLVKHDVSKFCGIYAQVENQRRSGTSDVNILEDSLELYKLKHPKGSSFAFLHCWQLVKNVPKWAEGCIVECRRIPLPTRSGRQMAPASEPESDFVETTPTQVASGAGVGRMRVRPQGNRAAKEEHKNEKIRDSSIRAQAAAIVQMAEVSKKKADILEDQNVLMLFTAPETGIVSEAAMEYLELKRQVELKKLRLAEEEEFEAVQATLRRRRCEEAPDRTQTNDMNVDMEDQD